MARLAVFAFSLCMTMTASVRAQQVVVFDEHWVHEASTPDSHYNVAVRDDTPPDFEVPVDYAGGTLHFRMEVLDKPTDERTHMVFCWSSQPTYSCAGQSPGFEGLGVVEWSTPLERFWHPGSDSPDFSRGISGLSAIVKDTENGKPTEDNVGAERAARFFPLELRLVATLVAAGARYEPPSVDEPIPDDAGVEDAGTDAGEDWGEIDAGAGPGDAGTPDVSLDDAGYDDAGHDAGVHFDPDARLMSDARRSDAAPNPGDASAPARGCTVGSTRDHGSSVAWLMFALVLVRSGSSRG